MHFVPISPTPHPTQAYFYVGLVRTRNLTIRGAAGLGVYPTVDFIFRAAGLR